MSKNNEKPMCKGIEVLSVHCGKRHFHASRLNDIHAATDDGPLGRSLQICVSVLTVD